MESPGGLAEEWVSVQQVLAKIIPVYDRMNKIMSLGRDTSFRRDGLQKGLRPADRVLDAGAGPGRMTEIALENLPNLEEIVMIDPMKMMLEESKERVRDPRISRLVAVFESLPFRDSVFDSAMCGFSLRDARHLNNAIAQLTRVLDQNSGRLIVIDLGKPNSSLARFFIAAYWKAVVPFLGLLFTGTRGLLYYALYKTYRKLPTNAALIQKFELAFRSVHLEERMLGGAIILVAEK